MNNTNFLQILLTQTNVVYKFTCPFRKLLSENDITHNSYIGHTTTILSRRFTSHLSDINALKQHLMTKHNKDIEKHKSPDIRKILINNAKIKYKISNKNRLQILQTITMQKKNYYKKHSRQV